MKRFSTLFLIALSLANFSSAQTTKTVWPTMEKQMKPWVRWWWMGSAVDEKNLTTNLSTYQKAGIGGVEITPIYGAVGYESKYIDFLSPKWMNMLQFTIAKSNSLGLGVDMNTGQVGLLVDRKLNPKTQQPNSLLKNTALKKAKN